MRIFNKFQGTKGFISGWQEVVRWRDMITQKAKRRYEILVFWEKHGLPATLDAFKVKKRTLFTWKKKLNEGGGKIESLNPGSRAPRVRRQRLWDARIVAELRRLRIVYPNLGKEKLYPLLREFCIPLTLTYPKPKTIGRLMHDLGGLRRFPEKITHFGKIKRANRQKVLRKPKDFKALFPGHCVALDTFEEINHGMRRYVITFEDIYTRFGFAMGTSSHASLAAREFFKLCIQVFPFPLTFVLTDNGSEFKKHFDEELRRLHLLHYHTYPKTPKMNAHAERFNKTVQESFSNFHKDLLFNDLERFNTLLAGWLLFYNLKRVHYAFKNLQSPIQFMLSLSVSILPAECKRGWPHTRS
ncbi:MAG: integrase core domain-containing protein [bacterium]|nr:integrase core domain-containing protein [bacterium]MDZ4285939.1 integrase core domain-containing protein [Candidatus Sungbacteria bacterium]